MGFVVVMGRPMATSQDFVNWVCTDELNWRFLKFVLQAEHGTFLRFASGTTHQTIYFPEVKAFHVCLPDLAEQRRIVQVLGSLDDKIESNRRLAALLEETAAALFRARFVDFIGITDLVDSEIGRIPAGWHTAPLGSLIEINAASRSIRNAPSEIEYVDISSVSTRRIDNVQRLRFADAPSRARRIVRSGDTIVSTVRPERRSFAFVHAASATLTASTGFAVITPTKAGPVFVYQHVTCDAFIDYLSQSATGSAYPAVNPKVIGSRIVALPPDHGAGLEATARPLLGLRAGLDTESAALAAIRDTLLPKLISGAIRVPDTPDPDEVIGPAAEALGA